MPDAQVMTAGLAAPAAKLGRQIVPGDSGLEDEQDARENHAIVQRFATGPAEPTLGNGRQQGLDSLPKFICDESFHGTPPQGIPETILQITEQLRACQLKLFLLFFPNALSRLARMSED